ncbi:MAG: hypothetical protein A2751_02455 [Candidatus Doudnabacteria bacterium RIFCSPHIGHO2_01_FULL_46_14]|uniref:Uncharacterized protein n=1 Tax=Candidatus Doudnabacteria bacterium RIFCSPHIGHO2_01_FULL_46_14 TaxID=1817824 RepID=A0A1F5NK03_9BACT|nr:MAG: hypothetical protein A2751_02455 [Candidatus Doudnabacteria bacterium RIFCSPHIGHO2_01_FULL_46_14]
MHIPSFVRAGRGIVKFLSETGSIILVVRGKLVNRLTFIKKHASVSRNKTEAANVNIVKASIFFIIPKLIQMYKIGNKSSMWLGF